MRNNDLVLAYRSITRPNPFWEEQALYGGYKYVQLCEGVWIPRTHEAYLHLLLGDVPQSIKDYAKSAVMNKDILFHPTQMQQCDAIKFLLTLKSQAYFAISGYSLVAENFLCTIPYTKLYTDADYSLPRIQKATTEQLCALSSHMIVLVHKENTSVKSSIRNWGNVLTYDASSFDMPTNEYYLTGG